MTETSLGILKKVFFLFVLFIRVDLMQHNEIVLNLLFVLIYFKAVWIVWSWCSEYITYFIFTVKLSKEQMMPTVHRITVVEDRGFKTFGFCSDTDLRTQLTNTQFKLKDQLCIFSGSFTSLMDLLH